ncbi:hypothetical protein ACJ73_08742 [Blastomyces percursus]|uniref:Uncharacterized protein n=1 Tax=Blastomyces percursus TaxID=1658174 RepID=A0A1J9QQK0_9EURO|nr:hypothetical protein ACJ73_08742 [Blastomyces percursus]
MDNINDPTSANELPPWFRTILEMQQQQIAKMHASQQRQYEDPATARESGNPRRGRRDAPAFRDRNERRPDATTKRTLGHPRSLRCFRPYLVL